MRDELVTRELIREEGRENWKRGKKLEYSLTDKGRMHLVRGSLENLETVDKAITQMYATPQRLQELQRYLLKWNHETKGRIQLAFQKDIEEHGI